MCALLCFVLLVVFVFLVVLFCNAMVIFSSVSPDVFFLLLMEFVIGYFNVRACVFVRLADDS